MTTLRFDYQRRQVHDALEYIVSLPASPLGPLPEHSLILNVGCNEDPGHLKQVASSHVVNCDLFARDAVLDQDNAVDVLFDCARDSWPFEDQAAALVVFGDILEHLKPAEIRSALHEARRVSRRLCITVPCDRRESCCDMQANLMPRGAVHRTTVTEDLLRELLAETGWAVDDFQEVEYDSGQFWGKRTMGYFVGAQ